MEYIKNELLNELNKLNPNIDFLISEYVKLRESHKKINDELKKVKSILEKINKAKRDKREKENKQFKFKF